MNQTNQTNQLPSGQNRQLLGQDRSVQALACAGLELGVVQVGDTRRRAAGRVPTDSNHGLRSIFGRRSDRQGLLELELAAVA